MWRNDGPRISANPLRELFDACAQGYSLKFLCPGCSRLRIFRPHAVWHHFRRHGWSEELRHVARHFRCSLCRRRGPDMELVREEPNDHSLPMPGEDVWKRELRRRR